MDRRSIFLALFIFIIIVFSLYFTFQENPILVPETAVDKEELPEAELADVSFSIFNKQQDYELKLKSSQVENYSSGNRMELTLIEVEVYSLVSDQLLYSLRGDFGTYYSEENHLKIRGNVLIESDRYQIQADELDYYLKRSYLSGRGSVKINGNDFNSSGESFNSDLDLKNLKLIGNSDQARINFDD